MSSRWKPGQSGNPAGKRPDSRLAEFRKAIEGDVPGIIQTMAFLAQNGDVQAARLLLERAIPPLRPEAPSVVLPALGKAEGFAAKSEAILAAVAGGEITPDVASTLLAGVAQASRVAEIDTLEKRISELERRALA
jgi:hypothetical protein